MTKRDLVLTDKTGAVTTTLWGEDVSKEKNIFINIYYVFRLFHLTGKVDQLLPSKEQEYPILAVRMSIDHVTKSILFLLIKRTLFVC